MTSRLAGTRKYEEGYARTLSSGNMKGIEVIKLALEKKGVDTAGMRFGKKLLQYNSETGTQIDERALLKEAKKHLGKDEQGKLTGKVIKSLLAASEWESDAKLLRAENWMAGNFLGQKIKFLQGRAETREVKMAEAKASKILTEEKVRGALDALGIKNTEANPQTQEEYFPLLGFVTKPGENGKVNQLRGASVLWAQPMLARAEERKALSGGKTSADRDAEGMSLTEKEVKDLSFSALALNSRFSSYFGQKVTNAEGYFAPMVAGKEEGQVKDYELANYNTLKDALKLDQGKVDVAVKNLGLNEQMLSEAIKRNVSLVAAKLGLPEEDLKAAMQTGEEVNSIRYIAGRQMVREGSAYSEAEPIGDGKHGFRFNFMRMVESATQLNEIVEYHDIGHELMHVALDRFNARYQKEVIPDATRAQLEAFYGAGVTKMMIGEDGKLQISLQLDGNGSYNEFFATMGGLRLVQANAGTMDFKKNVINQLTRQKLNPEDVANKDFTELFGAISAARPDLRINTAKENTKQYLNTTGQTAFSPDQKLAYVNNFIQAALKRGIPVEVKDDQEFDQDIAQEAGFGKNIKGWSRELSPGIILRRSSNPAQLVVAIAHEVSHVGDRTREAQTPGSMAKDIRDLEKFIGQTAGEALVKEFRAELKKRTVGYDERLGTIVTEASKGAITMAQARTGLQSLVKVYQESPDFNHDAALPAVKAIEAVLAKEEITNEDLTSLKSEVDAMGLKVKSDFGGGTEFFAVLAPFLTRPHEAMAFYEHDGDTLNFAMRMVGNPQIRAKLMERFQAMGLPGLGATGTDVSSPVLAKKELAGEKGKLEAPELLAALRQNEFAVQPPPRRGNSAVEPPVDETLVSGPPPELKKGSSPVEKAEKTKAEESGEPQKAEEKTQKGRRGFKAAEEGTGENSPGKMDVKSESKFPTSSETAKSGRRGFKAAEEAIGENSPGKMDVKSESKSPTSSETAKSGRRGFKAAEEGTGENLPGKMDPLTKVQSPSSSSSSQISAPISLAAPQISISSPTLKSAAPESIIPVAPVSAPLAMPLIGPLSSAATTSNNQSGSVSSGISLASTNNAVSSSEMRLAAGNFAAMTPSSSPLTVASPTLLSASSPTMQLASANVPDSFSSSPASLSGQTQMPSFNSPTSSALQLTPATVPSVSSPMEMGRAPPTATDRALANPSTDFWTTPLTINTPASFNTHALASMISTYRPDIDLEKIKNQITKIAAANNGSFTAQEIASALGLKKESGEAQHFARKAMSDRIASVTPSRSQTPTKKSSSPVASSSSKASSSPITITQVMAELNSPNLTIARHQTLLQTANQLLKSDNASVKGLLAWMENSAEKPWTDMMAQMTPGQITATLTPGTVEPASLYRGLVASRSMEIALARYPLAQNEKRDSLDYILTRGKEDGAVSLVGYNKSGIQNIFEGPAAISQLEQIGFVNNNQGLILAQASIGTMGFGNLIYGGAQNFLHSHPFQNAINPSTSDKKFFDIRREGAADGSSPVTARAEFPQGFTPKVQIRESGKDKVSVLDEAGQEEAPLRSKQSSRADRNIGLPSSWRQLPDTKARV